MNANWIMPALTVLGLVMNAVWTLTNAHATSQIEKQFVKFKEWAAEEFVSERICAARMAHLPTSPVVRAAHRGA
jgi:hypothetical protein